MIAEMERVGVESTHEVLTALSQEFGERQVALEKQIFQRPDTHSTSASKQLGEVLFGELD
ncbi:hypothetical protein CCP2SC5_1890003 [Azospirillaceae bacterium]